MASVQQKFKSFEQKLESDLEGIEMLEMVSNAASVKKAHIAMGVSTLVALFIFLGVGAGILCNLVGFVYPAYASFKAIETKRTDDDTLWLTYWVVYAALCIVETFSDIILSWIPFYYVVKLGLLMWCMHPSTQGAVVIYKNVLAPFLLNHQETVDRTLDDVTRVGAKVSSSAAEAASTVAREQLASAMSRAAADPHTKKDE
eukprot:CAMPEP_0196770058 /NCGR_PEP_ID=MMETSP1104-20130614/909_1 /TAXON_ID=33652 /ORGANISM="Cafeteria sp., Strain Caron Lab Isolate" /LENGTH=200 /DNA_ID=CAMNT_0042140165 /DNA_START=40 /DNA_END=642 /DNA_ORIENTATION=-